MDKIRIGFIAATLGTGGAENVLLEVISRLPAERFDWELYFLNGAGSVGKQLLGRGHRGTEHLSRHRLDGGVLFRLVAGLKSFSPHVVFLLDHHNALFWGGLSSMIARVPRRVIGSHSTGRMHGRKNFTVTDRFFMGGTDTVIALSRSHARYLEEMESIERGRIEVIENGIDIDRYETVDEGRVSRLRAKLGVGSEEKIVVMVAALRPEKAHETLFDAASFLVSEGRRVKFLLVGDGPRRAHLESLAAARDLRAHVHFLGERDDVPELLHLAHVLVLPSHPAVETLPLAVLEAMAAGVPVVASAVGSVPDVIENGVNGRLIAPGDAGGLGAAICYIIDNNQEAMKMAERARETVRGKYTVEKMVSKYRALFQRLAS